MFFLLIFYLLAAGPLPTLSLTQATTPILHYAFQAGDPVRDLLQEHVPAHQSDSWPYQLQLVEELGQGALGTVFLVNTGMPNADNLVLKTLSRSIQFPGFQDPADELFPNERDSLPRIRDELSQHPDPNLRAIGEKHIVELRGSFVTAKYYGLLLSPIGLSNLDELLEAYTTTPAGNDFILVRKKYLLEKSLVTSWLWGYFRDLAEVVHCLHSLGFEHNDITPKNILCGNINEDGAPDPDGTLLLCDFGIAQNVAKDHWEPSVAKRPLSDRLHNAKWTSPERLQRLEKQPYKSDLYNVGLVFLELYTVLKGKTLKALDDFLERWEDADNDHDMPILIRNKRCQMEVVRVWLTTLGEPDVISFLILNLIRYDPDERLDSATLVEFLKRRAP